MAATHTDKTFENDLRALREKLLAMGARVEEQIALSVRALTERDTALPARVKASDREVNVLEIEVDDLCRKILALRQPAASDLRFITTALKIVVDLERIGDLAVNIAERAADLNEAPPLKQYQDTPRLAEMAQQQVRRALDAFVAGDTAKAEDVLRGDDHLDDLFVKIFNELLTYMMEDSRNIRRANALLSIAKHLERIGDHAVNLAEMVIYMVRGTDIRHARSRGLEWVE
ncbi:MAG: phosphate signaling complex protein PhoU [Myxococcaceae bacterium]|nr:phosphate signaling complex protein PhoU [Myxococcaceae bacterium]MCI0670906.1 phosphate signaling complex protein PhoU [Myxococcaceae bacterium]